MTLLRFAALVAFLAALALAPAGAVTSLPSADGQFWDIQDTSPWAQDSGGIATGGRANPFNGFGYLKLQVRRGRSGPLTVRNHYLRGFGLAHDGGERFDSITPVLHDGVVVSRAIFAPKDAHLPPLLRQCVQQHRRAPHRAGGVGRRRRRLRRRRTRGGGHDLERRCADRRR